LASGNKTKGVVLSNKSELIKQLNPLATTPALWRNLMRTVGSAMANYGISKVSIELHGTDMKVTAICDHGSRKSSPTKSLTARV